VLHRQPLHHHPPPTLVAAAAGPSIMMLMFPPRSRGGAAAPSPPRAPIPSRLHAVPLSTHALLLCSCACACTVCLLGGCAPGCCSPQPRLCRPTRWQPGRPCWPPGAVARMPHRPACGALLSFAHLLPHWPESQRMTITWRRATAPNTKHRRLRRSTAMSVETLKSLGLHLRPEW